MPVRLKNRVLRWPTPYFAPTFSDLTNDPSNSTPHRLLPSQSPTLLEGDDFDIVQ